MNTIASGVALALAATTFWLAPLASAQSTAPEARRPDPMNPKAQVPALVYRSAFQSYRPNAEVELGSWLDANKAVQQAGGWRAYAKEARQPDEAVAPLPAASAAPAASAPAKPASTPAGHAHH
ncbi:hypothetical protein J7U46_19325 [Pelomonas sp. V22]|uniref:hypothetical protein n=1 Tax=Pelomonas sp. V22 TaxID=2822139 RepID=UPI0024A82AAC|nr:hypothetical protein [Pelomonas sp. V22]MDI4635223.1 hypothetical protein [Pelomonas sp. V22]